MLDYVKIIKEKGYDPILFFNNNIVSKVYKIENNKLLKISYFNPQTKGLLNEYEILSKIKHLNFVPKISHYEKIMTEDTFIEMLIMDYIEGEKLQKSNFSPKIKEIILEKFKILHENNIIHGDVKEDNILINNENVYIIDFDQSYISKKTEDFNHSQDMIGNIYCENLQMNLKELFKRFK